MYTVTEKASENINTKQADISTDLLL